MFRPPGGIRATIAIALDTFFLLRGSIYTKYSLICSDRAHNLRIYNCKMLSEEIHFDIDDVCALNGKKCIFIQHTPVCSPIIIVYSNEREVGEAY